MVDRIGFKLNVFNVDGVYRNDNDDLLSQREVLEGELSVGTENGEEGSEQC